MGGSAETAAVDAAVAGSESAELESGFPVSGWDARADIREECIREEEEEEDTPEEVIQAEVTPAAQTTAAGEPIPRRHPR